MSGFIQNTNNFAGFNNQKNYVDRISKEERTLRRRWEGRISDVLDNKQISKNRQLEEFLSILKESQYQLNILIKNPERNQDKIEYHGNLQTLLHELITAKTEEEKAESLTTSYSSTIQPFVPPALPKPETHEVFREGNKIGDRHFTVGDGDCLIHAIIGKSQVFPGENFAQYRSDAVSQTRAAVIDRVLEAVSPNTREPNRVAKALYKQWWIERLQECGELLKPHAENHPDVPASTKKMFNENKTLLESPTREMEHSNLEALNTFIHSDEAKTIFSEQILGTGTYINNRSEMALFALQLGNIHIVTPTGDIEPYEPYKIPSENRAVAIILGSNFFEDNEKSQLRDFLIESSTTEATNETPKFACLVTTGESHYEHFTPVLRD